MADDAWYQSEESTRAGMLQEIQRIRRRTRVRPLPVILLALFITGGITYKVAKKKTIYYAEIVLAMREGSLANQNKATGLPLEELKEFVATVLIPDARLTKLIEERNLLRLRKKLGMPWAITELRDSIEIEIWRNSFIYYDPDESNREASARIGLTVGQDDPDDAFLIAKDLAQIVISEVREHRVGMATHIAKDVSAMRESMQKRMTELERELTVAQVERTKAREAGKTGLAQAIDLRIAEIAHDQKEVEKNLSNVLTSQDAIADRIAEAGLDLVVEIVSERRPNRPESKGMVVVMIAVVIGVGAFLGAALVLGAFDSRVHDVDDVLRLGLPVLGHVPGFPGDRLGSLEARGVQRGRVPSFLRWRSR
jgi:hypothetical protein